METAAQASCVDCGTELAPAMRACPACGGLVHRDRLRKIAARAETLEAEGKLEDARAMWTRALDLLPPTSQQYAIVQQTCGRLAKENERQRGPKVADDAPWWKRGVAAIGAAVLVLLGKLKFLLLGLTKGATLISMLFAARLSGAGAGTSTGLVILGVFVSIYIHEMGHVTALVSAGMDAEAPLFVPGLGAFVLLRRHIADPAVDARVGLAGPIWGLGAAVAAYIVFLFTHAPVWHSIAQWGALLNLFNLVPVWTLDGARGFHALTRVQRWVVVAVFAAAYLTVGSRLAGLLAIVALYRSFDRDAPTTPNRVVLAQFVGLIATLSWLSMGVLPS